MTGRAFSVIVPVCNEASVLRETAPLLLEGLEAAEVLFVCNGCSDGSAAILAGIVGDRARILDLPEAGKARAIRAAEAEVAALPRFYVDADVRVRGAVLIALSEVLRTGSRDLVSPRIVVDLAGSTRPARWITQVWRALPYARAEGFHNVLGVSAAGRAGWGAFPDLVADDAFITAQIPPARRQVIAGVTAEIRTPRTFGAWVRVRARWLRGLRELRRSGIASPPAAGQRGALLRLALRGQALPVATYVLARGLAEILSRAPVARRGTWYQDRTSRVSRQSA